MCHFVLRYTLRNKDEDDVCEELVIMLAQTLEAELCEVGPEDVLSESQLEELESTLEERVMMMTMIIIIVHKELTVSYQ